MHTMRTILVAGAASTIMALASFTPALAGGSGSSGGSSNSNGSFSSRNQNVPQYDPVVDYQRGVESFQSGDFRDAEKAFSKVLKASSRHAPTNLFMGLTKTELGNDKSAAKYYKSAVKADKKLYEAYDGLGTSYARIGKKDKARDVVEDLQKAQSKCGDCSDSTRIQTAIDNVEAAISGKTGDRASLVPFGHLDAGDTYFTAVSQINQGEYQTAFNDLSLASAVAGPHPDITTYMGYTQRKLGNYDAAKSYYAMALEVDPSHKGANEYLGELYVETGEMELANLQLAKLEEICSFGCIEEEELRGWIVDALP